MTQLQDFLAHLMRGGQHGLWWTDDYNRSLWWPTSNIPSAPGEPKNWWFGVHPVSQIPPTNSRGESVAQKKIRSQIEYISAVNCLFADVDGKSFVTLDDLDKWHVERTAVAIVQEAKADGRNVTKENALTQAIEVCKGNEFLDNQDKYMARALSHCNAMTPEPSVIICSGGGYHCYWLLDEPFLLQAIDDRAHAKDVQERWVEFVEADTGAKDLARVLRVPGTRNRKKKYAPDFPEVYFVKCDLALLYKWLALAEAMPKQKPKPEPARAPALRIPQASGADDWTRAIETAQNKIAMALDGEKHIELLRAARLLGGYVAGGFGDIGEARSALRMAIESKAGVEDLEQAYRTIEDGLRDGHGAPITPEQKEREREAWRAANGKREAPPAMRQQARVVTGGNGAGKESEEKRATIKTDEAALKKLAEQISGSDPMVISVRAKEAERKGMATQQEVWRAAYEATFSNGHKTNKGKPTDDELRDIWIAQAPNTAYGMGEWRRYEDGFWPTISEATIKKEIEGVIERKKDAGIKPGKQILSSVYTLAQVERTREVWDNDIDLIACRNGVLHVPTGELREHSPENYITHALPFDYDESADCPMLKRVIESAVPFAAGLLQEFAGYCLTPDVKYETALWLFGPRGSGKSTVVGAFQAMLGRRAGILGLAEVEQSRFALARIPGKTLVVATEQPAAYLRATHILNAIISGETVTVDIKFKPAFDFRPVAKMLWSMDKLPNVQNSQSGLFRRIKLITFPPLACDPDPSVKETILQEGAGILNWALDGLRRLRARGKFAIPQEVIMATEDFETQNDIAACFVEECCIKQVDAVTSVGDLHQKYLRWRKASGYKPVSKRTAAKDWERLGFHSGRDTSGKRAWFGVGLVTQDEYQYAEEAF